MLRQKIKQGNPVPHTAVEARQKLDNCSIKKYSCRGVSGVSPWQPCACRLPAVRRFDVVKNMLMPDKPKAAVQLLQLHSAD